MSSVYSTQPHLDPLILPRQTSSQSWKLTETKKCRIFHLSPKLSVKGAQKASHNIERGKWREDWDDWVKRPKTKYLLYFLIVSGDWLVFYILFLFLILFSSLLIWYYRWQCVSLENKNDYLYEKLGGWLKTDGIKMGGGLKAYFYILHEKTFFPPSADPKLFNVEEVLENFYYMYECRGRFLQAWNIQAVVIHVANAFFFP